MKKVKALRSWNNKRFEGRVSLGDTLEVGDRRADDLVRTGNAELIEEKAKPKPKKSAKKKRQASPPKTKPDGPTENK